MTILIGIVWQGRPIAGVINQPFNREQSTNSFKERIIWGIVGIGFRFFLFFLLKLNLNVVFIYLKISN